jgi:hypothetical protein
MLGGNRGGDRSFVNTDTGDFRGYQTPAGGGGGTRGGYPAPYVRNLATEGYGEIPTHTLELPPKRRQII